MPRGICPASWSRPFYSSRPRWARRRRSPACPARAAACSPRSSRHCRTRHRAPWRCACGSFHIPRRCAAACLSFQPAFFQPAPAWFSVRPARHAPCLLRAFPFFPSFLHPAFQAAVPRAPPARRTLPPAARRPRGSRLFPCLPCCSSSCTLPDMHSPSSNAKYSSRGIVSR